MSQLKCKKNFIVYFIQTTRDSTISSYENCKKKKKENRSRFHYTLYLNFKTCNL